MRLSKILPRLTSDTKQKVLKIIAQFDVNVAAQQFHPHIKKYEEYFKNFKVAAKFVKAGGFVKDGNKLRIRFITRDKNRGFVLKVSYNAGLDLYDVDSFYWQDGDLYPIKSISGIYFDQFEDPDIFFPGNKMKQVIDSAPKEKRNTELSPEDGISIPPKEFLDKIIKKYKAKKQGNFWRIPINNNYILVFRQRFMGNAYWMYNIGIYEDGKAGMVGKIDPHKIPKEYSMAAETDKGWENFQKMIESIKKAIEG